MIWDELINFGQRQQCMHVSMRFIKLLQPELIFFNLSMFVVSNVCFTQCVLLRSTPVKFFKEFSSSRVDFGGKSG